MIYLISAQPPPSIQDFSDLEQALIGSTGEEDLQTKTESVKAAFQWVKRFAVLLCCIAPHRLLLVNVCAVLNATRVMLFMTALSLRRDAKASAAPSSSLAKAGSILTKAVGNFVGGSSGSAITQVPRVFALLSDHCIVLIHFQVMCPLLEKGTRAPLSRAFLCSRFCLGVLPDDWRVADPRDSRGGDFNGSRGNSLPIGGAREVRYNGRIRRSLLVIILY